MKTKKVLTPAEIAWKQECRQRCKKYAEKSKQKLLDGGGWKLGGKMM